MDQTGDVKSILSYFLPGTTKRDRIQKPQSPKVEAFIPTYPYRFRIFDIAWRLGATRFVTPSPKPETLNANFGPSLPTDVNASKTPGTSELKVLGFRV